MQDLHEVGPRTLHSHPGALAEKMTAEFRADGCEVWDIELQPLYWLCLGGPDRSDGVMFHLSDRCRILQRLAFVFGQGNGRYARIRVHLHEHGKEV